VRIGLDPDRSRSLENELEVFQVKFVSLLYHRKALTEILLHFLNLSVDLVV